jgi:hypothetical protein
MEMSTASLLGCFVPGEGAPRCPLAMRLDRLLARSELCIEETNLFPCWEFNSDFLVAHPIT